MNFEHTAIYNEDIIRVATLPYKWEKLQDCRIVVSGATGMIGKFLIDVLLYKNKQDKLGCTVYALGRSREKAERRLGNGLHTGEVVFSQCDINDAVVCGVPRADYVLHLASETHPVAYAIDPIGTITANVIGTNRLLEYAVGHNCRRFVFASSVEIYGENRGDTDLFDEAYCGYIDCNTLRAGYPESKRTGEALCQAYRKSCGMDIVIPRLSRTFGPTVLPTDTKAISQFIGKAVAGENIILKSAGMQFYSYSYVADAVSGILCCLLQGEDGEAYNVACDSCNISLKDLAALCADFAGKQVIFERPDENESAGYSKATRAVLNSAKLAALGWKPMYDIKQGIERTICALREEI